MERSRGRFFASILFVVLMMLSSSCTRNPLGEEIASEILNQDFTLSHSCTTLIPELTPFNCQLQTSQPLTNVVWSLEPASNCNWATLDVSTGEISGTTLNVSFGRSCNLIVKARSANRVSPPLTLALSLSSLSPTISYSGSYTFQAGHPLVIPVTPTLSDGTPTSCTALPSLPTGLVINSTTCIISGTPTITTAQQTYTITASNAFGGRTATVSLGVIPSTPNNISLTGVSSFTTSFCAPFSIIVRDALGNVANVTSDTVFNLSGAGAFYSDASCASAITTTVVANQTSAAGFYYRKITPGLATLAVDLASPATPAIMGASRNVNVTGSTPARLELIVASTGTTVSCSSVTINLLDSNSVPVNTVSARTVSLSGTGSALFYTNPSCATTATNLTIGAGTNTGTIYMRKITAGSSTLTATSSGMGNGTGTIVISLAPTNRIIFSAAATSPYAISTCQTYTIQTRDALNNNVAPVAADTTISLSGVADGSFYSNSACTAGNEITTTTILNGTSARTIYYSKPTTTAVVPGANITLTASVSGWSPDATTSVNVSTGIPTHLGTNNTAIGLAILSATNVAIASRCLLTTVRVHDETNTLVPTSRVLSNITATLSGGGAGAQFWSNATCTTPISSITINAGTNTRNFYYSSTTTTPTVAMSWTNGGLSGNGASRNITVTSGVPSRLTWTTAPTSFNTNTCQTYTFNVRDPNTVTAIGATVTTATDFQLSDGSDGVFYSGAGCTTPVTTIRVAASGQAVSFYYRKATAGTPTISVSLQSPITPFITTLTRAITVTAPPLIPNNILITASPSTGLIANQSCSLLTLQSRNGVTAANVTANSTFTLSGTNGAQFYLDNGCTALAPATTMTILSNTNTVSGLYVKGTNSGNVTLNGSGPITVISLTVNYSAAPPTALALAGPVIMNAGVSCGSFTVHTQDALGTNQNVLSDTVVTVSSVGAQAVQFYTDSLCTTPLPSNQRTISTGSNTAQFYTRGNTAGSSQIQVTATGLTSANHSLYIQ